MEYPLSVIYYKKTNKTIKCNQNKEMISCMINIQICNREDWILSTALAIVQANFEFGAQCQPIPINWATNDDIDISIKS